MNINKYFCYQGHHSEGNQYQLPLRKDYLILNNKDISYKNVLPYIYKRMRNMNQYEQGSRRYPSPE